MGKYIVTGAGGFIGNALCNYLLNNGHLVYGIDIAMSDNLKELLKNESFKFIEAGFDDYKDLNSKINDKKIDAFFHFAWAGVFGDAFKDYSLQLNNTRAACDAIMAAKSIGVKRFVFAATNNEIDAKRFTYMDDFKPRFTNIYATAKLSAELICKTLAYNYGIEYSAGMICMAYGEGNRSKMLANVLIESLNNGISPKLIEGNNLYDMIYIQDIVRAFYAIATKGKNMKTYYVGHRKLKTFKEWVTIFRDVIAPNVILKFGEFKDDLNMDYSKIDLDALFNDTGFECSYPLIKSIVNTASWLKYH